MYETYNPKKRKFNNRSPQPKIPVSSKATPQRKKERLERNISSGSRPANNDWSKLSHSDDTKPTLKKKNYRSPQSKFSSGGSPLSRLSLKRDSIPSRVATPRLRSPGGDDMDPLSAEIDEFHKEKQDPEYEEFVMKSIDSFSIHTPVKSVKVDLSYSQNTVPENLKKQFTKNGFLSSNGQFSHKDSLKND
jgi:hypothetical protein